MTPVEVCLYCAGDGYKWDGGPCDYCGGTGVIEEDDDDDDFLFDDLEDEE